MSNTTNSISILCGRWSQISGVAFRDEEPIGVDTEQLSHDNIAVDNMVKQMQQQTTSLSMQLSHIYKVMSRTEFSMQKKTLNQWSGLTKEKSTVITFPSSETRKDRLE